MARGSIAVCGARVAFYTLHVCAPRRWTPIPRPPDYVDFVCRRCQASTPARARGRVIQFCAERAAATGEAPMVGVAIVGR
eukprot:11213480-Lingulodinium_polyedra.AAC.1